MIAPELAALWPMPPAVAWPIALALAWMAGEAAYRLVGFPRIGAYGLVGFLLANVHGGLLLPDAGGAIPMLAHIALGLVLFELGYRINLGWLRHNPWIGVTGVVESGLTFVAVFTLAWWLGEPTIPSLMLAALAMATSPAAVLRVVNEQGSNGQVTERTLHLTALNCVLAVLAFKAILGYYVFQSSGNLGRALWTSLLLLAFSAAIGATFGIAIPALLERVGRRGRDVTVAFAIAVIVLVSIVHALKYSPVLAALVFGIVARHRRVVLSPAERNFGALGNLLTVLLFVFVAASLDAAQVAAGAAAALAIIGVRAAAKIAGVVAFAQVSGITWRKGLLTGLALTPISAFALLLLEQTRNVGITMDGLPILAAVVLLLEIGGPLVTQRALILAGEVPQRTD